MLACMMVVTASCDTPETIAQWYPRFVEPRIGTAHCRYFHFAPGAMPFGMAKPGPSTNGHLGNKDGWEATGYAWWWIMATLLNLFIATTYSLPCR